MQIYRLLSTRRNHDGSFDVPSVDIPLEAADDAAAVNLARRFPLDAFGDTDMTWLVDGEGRVVWSSTVPLSRAA